MPFIMETIQYPDWGNQLKNNIFAKSTDSSMSSIIIEIGDFYSYFATGLSLEKNGVEKPKSQKKTSGANKSVSKRISTIQP